MYARDDPPLVRNRANIDELLYARCRAFDSIAHIHKQRRRAGGVRDRLTPTDHSRIFQRPPRRRGKRRMFWDRSRLAESLSFQEVVHHVKSE